MDMLLDDIKPYVRYAKILHMPGDYTARDMRAYDNRILYFLSENASLTLDGVSYRPERGALFLWSPDSVYSLSALYAYHKFMRKTDYLFAAFSDSSFIYTILSRTVSGADTDLFILYHYCIASFTVRRRYHCLYTASYGIFKNKLSVTISSYH